MCGVLTDIERKGRMAGRTEGLAKGRIEGINKETIRVYKNCIKRGMSRADAIACPNFLMNFCGQSVNDQVLKA